MFSNVLNVEATLIYKVVVFMSFFNAIIVRLVRFLRCKGQLQELPFTYEEKLNTKVIYFFTIVGSEETKFAETI